MAVGVHTTEAVPGSVFALCRVLNYFAVAGWNLRYEVHGVCIGYHSRNNNKRKTKVNKIKLDGKCATKGQKVLEGAVVLSKEEKLTICTTKFTFVLII